MGHSAASLKRDLGSNFLITHFIQVKIIKSRLKVKRHELMLDNLENIGGSDFISRLLPRP